MNSEKCRFGEKQNKGGAFINPRWGLIIYVEGVRVMIILSILLVIILTIPVIILHTNNTNSTYNDSNASNNSKNHTNDNSDHTTTNNKHNNTSNNTNNIIYTYVFIYSHHTRRREAELLPERIRVGRELGALLNY